MQQWKTNTKAAIANRQLPVVVYHTDKHGDNINGLGHSQKGEVAYLEKCEIPYMLWDVRDFEDHAVKYAKAQLCPRLAKQFQIKGYQESTGPKLRKHASAHNVLA